MAHFSAMCKPLDKNYFRLRKVQYLPTLQTGFRFLKMKIKQIIFTLLLFSTVPALAGLISEVQINSVIAHLSEQQTTGSDGYDIGQWRAQVTSTVPEFIGVGRFNIPYEEPTAFVAASIANILAEIYLINPRFSAIPDILNMTELGLESYRTGDLFNFYPPKYYENHLVRGPRYMYLKKKWYGFTNVPSDSDTTSVAYLFWAYQNSLLRNESVNNSDLQVPPAVLSAFAQYRDVGREPHVYNSLHGYSQTKAHLTWLFDENNPEMPRDWFATPEKGIRIPFNKNDVDCVVNTNVLKMLQATHHSDEPGFAETCQYLNQVAEKREYYHCGMYYPSTYAFPYSMATALNLGVSCLEPGRETVLNNILARQQKNGAWRNDLEARADFIQSTAWALSTLLQLGDRQNQKHREAAAKAIKFLLKQAQVDSKGQMFWPGEVFYAAIFIARFPVVWRSESYTTATIAKALSLALRWEI